MVLFELEFFGGAHNRYTTVYNGDELPETIDMPDLLDPDSEPETYDRAGTWSTRKANGQTVLYAWYIARYPDRPRQGSNCE